MTTSRTAQTCSGRRYRREAVAILSGSSSPRRRPTNRQTAPVAATQIRRVIVHASRWCRRRRPARRLRRRRRTRLHRNHPPRSRTARARARLGLGLGLGISSAACCCCCSSYSRTVLASVRSAAHLIGVRFRLGIRVRMRVRVRVKTLWRHGARHVRAALAACPHEHALSRGSGAYARTISYGEIAQRRALQLPRC